MYNDIITEITQKFQKPKRKNEQVSFKFPKDHKERAKLLECSQSIHTTILEHQQSKDIKKNLSFFTCKSKFCPVCNKIKSNKWASALYKRTKELQEKESQRFLFLTLTVKNCKIEELHKTINNMNKAWNSFKKYNLMDTRKRGIKRFNGFVKILEITFPNGNEAHPHFHILLSANESYFNKDNKYYLTTKRISELWGKSLGVDYQPIVDIRIIKPKKTKQGEITKEAIPSVLAEMTKYPMKDTDYRKLTQKTMSILYSELYRKRLIATGGNLKISINQIENIGKEEEVSEEEMEEWKEIATLVLKYLNGGYALANFTIKNADSKPRHSEAIGVANDSAAGG